ncbi:hypothetical protein HAX54_020402 [Datura stramonium]|uniref:Uncharacterized protein n=1 Tax=Datura stramonium TaxID=4076 RepID=A0ABS8UTW2_DATST|nr:hypothetical protein [Datura stramonium]
MVSMAPLVSVYGDILQEEKPKERMVFLSTFHKKGLLIMPRSLVLVGKTFSAGSIGRSFKGEFLRWQIFPRICEDKPVLAKPYFSSFSRVLNGTRETCTFPVSEALSCLRKSEKSISVVSWVILDFLMGDPSQFGMVFKDFLAVTCGAGWILDWNLGGQNSSYHALYPRAWTVYDGEPDQALRIVCRQISLVLHNYKESSLPTAVFTFTHGSFDHLQSEEMSMPSEPGSFVGAAVAASLTIQQLMRYTKFYGTMGHAAAEIARDAIQEHTRWESQIEQWQKPIIEDKRLPEWMGSAFEDLQNPVSVNAAVGECSWMMECSAQAPLALFPHDIGMDDPWLQVNYYCLYNTDRWKDLNPKFVLQVYRDFVATGDKKFVSCLAIRLYGRWLSWTNLYGWGWDDRNDGFLIKHMHSVCLWCECLLWWPMGGSFAGCISPSSRSSGSAVSTSIQADQLAGQWYARACGLQPIVDEEKAKTALETVFNFNVMKVKDGRRGAVNGMRPNGEPDSI